MPYQEARKFARELFARLAANADVQSEVEAALLECLNRYDTAPYENRFIVGSVVEQVLGATARALGLDVRNAGAQRQAYDLELRPGYGLSIKYTSSSARSSTVRLTNSQGRSGVWSTGTIFAIAGLGIGYADPDLMPNSTVSSGDGKSIDVPVQRLRSLWGIPLATAHGPEPAWLAPIPVPQAAPGFFAQVNVPNRPAVRSPRLAGDPIALDILQSGRSQTLLRHFEWSI